MDGRVAMTSAARPGDPEHPQASVFSSAAGVKLTAASAFEMNSIWVSKEEVLATKRVDGRA
eukprot:COSAG04_NODE_207_length_20357_cov_14.209843_12_plen_61_part_00